MEIPYTTAEFESTSFNCPHCKAFASMYWSNLSDRHNELVRLLKIARCNHCYDYSLWLDSVMIYPLEISVESPNIDLPEDIKKDYLEAAEILVKSPRGASAILRLAIEKLANHLKAEGKDLNEQIGYLVAEKKLDQKIQKSLDIVRVIGNNAVHPGQIDLTDDKLTAEKLFRLVNIITKVMITEPNEIDQIYEEVIPPNQKKGIATRDKK